MGLSNVLLLMGLMIGNINPLEIKQVEGISLNGPSRKLSGANWLTVVVKDRLEVFRGPDDAAPIEDRGSRLNFGEIYWVMRHDKTYDRMLLARFKTTRSSASFDRFVGWVDSAWTLTANQCITVESARTQLFSEIVPGDPRRPGLEVLFPFSENSRETRNVPLKGVTDPERGTHGFAEPVAEADRKQVMDSLGQPETVAATPLEAFTWYYVAKVVTQGKSDVHVLLARSPQWKVSDTAISSEFKDKLTGELLGWIELRNLALWTTRMALELNLEERAKERRFKSNLPNQFFSRKGHLLDWADSKAANATIPDTTNEPFWTENPNDLLAKMKAWPATWMRYPILYQYDLPGKLVVDLEDGTKQHPPRGFHFIALGGTGGKGQSHIADPEDERSRAELRNAVKNFAVFELVLVLDTTASMEPVINKAKQALLRVVDQIKMQEEQSPELTRLDLRVAVVLYRDYQTKHSIVSGGKTYDFPFEWVVQDSSTYAPVASQNGWFEVTSPEGIKKFQDYMTTVKCLGNQDETEAPFEGLVQATDKFLRPGTGSSHVPGATTAILILGNGGNHPKDPKLEPDTRFDVQDVQERLGPILHEGRQIDSRVSLYSVFTPRQTGHTEPFWDEQMKVLTEFGGGRSVTVDFNTEAIEQTAAEEIQKCIAEVIQIGRQRLIEEIDALAGAWQSRQPTRPYVQIRAVNRLIEVVGKERFEEIKAGLSRSFFLFLHATDRIAEDGDTPRLKTSLLLTVQEVEKIAQVCENIADQYEQQVQDQSEALNDDPFKDLLVKVLAGALGNIKNPQELKRLQALPFGDIQEEIQHNLPVSFGCLRGNAPRSKSEARAFIAHLVEKSRGLRKAAEDASRLFNASGGVRKGEHLWIYLHELP